MQKNIQKYLSIPLKHPLVRHGARVLLGAACWAWIAWRIHGTVHRQGGLPYAQAYLDPSTGAMIVSAIVGIMATIALGAKTIWYKIRAPFRKRRTSQTDTSLSGPLQDQ